MQTADLGPSLQGSLAAGKSSLLNASTAATAFARHHSVHYYSCMPICFADDAVRNSAEQYLQSCEQANYVSLSSTWHAGS
jgi:hypothetical protein